MSELISIVVIGCNEEKNIACCLESCLKADWGNKEIIYCDSESNDLTVDIARQYPVRIIIHKNRRRNPSIGRNIGLKAARGDYVYFIDADMVLESGFLRMAFPVLLSRKDVACVVGIRKEFRPENFYVKMIDSSYHAYSGFGEVDSPSGGGGLFKRQPLLEVGGYYERFNCSEEQIVGQELRKKGYKIILIDAIMAYHDVGVYTFLQFLRFRARQARQFANVLLLNDHSLESVHRIAWKHVFESIMIVTWMVALILVSSHRLLVMSASGIGLIALFVWKYFHLKNHPWHNLFFLYEFILGKPFHIVFQTYYVFRMLLRDQPSNHPDGQIISDTANQVVCR